MDNQFKLLELAAAYHHLAYGYPVSSCRWNGYQLAADAYDAEQSLQAVQKRLMRLLQENKTRQERFSPDIQVYQRLEEEIVCFREALTAFRHGSLVVFGRRISLHEDGRK